MNSNDNFSFSDINKEDIADIQVIDRFFDEYRFLSNFWYADVVFEGIKYKSSEHAFQAAKSLDNNIRLEIANVETTGQAKRYGKKIELRPDWEEVKYDIMYKIVYDKFTRNKDLGEKLIATGDAQLIEGNTWGDQIWGVCKGKGTNWLGKILMKVREEIKCL